MSNTFFVSLDPLKTAQKVIDNIVGGSFTGELIDDYSVGGDAAGCRVLVFEKYYQRVNNRLILTVVIDIITGRTRVHYASGGGGEGMLFRFDWGAADSFAGCVQDALDSYII